MDKKYFIELCDQKLKLIRTEFSLSQDKMAIVLGISKKTLVEIEKSRSSLGWTGSVALCTLFSNSEIIDSTFGGNPKDIILSIAFEGCEPYYPKTLGGRAWWHTEKENEHYIIQQNIISQHYRLLTKDGKRISSSFNLEDLLPLYLDENSKRKDV